MDILPLQIQMLAGFVIRQGSEEVRISGRSRKLCLLLAILICERNRPVPCPELIDLLWQEEDRGPNPLNSLKAILHRARLCLDALAPSAGSRLILNREGCLQWSPDCPLTLDWEEFSRLCGAADQAREEERRLELGLEALSLYQGDFLPMLSGSPWAAGRTEDLRRQYLQAVPQVLSLLEARGRWQEAARTAGAALALDPLREDLCARQMEALLRLGRQPEAVQVYESFQERLLSRLGVIPSDGLRALCRKARKDQDPRLLSPDTLLERLKEPLRTGALLCDFDFFRVLCHAYVRRSRRDGEPVHVALISFSGPEGAPLPRHSLDRAMDNFQGIAVNRLRQGDAVARYGASQFVLLLPQAGLEDSRMVCRRLTQTFARQFPHSPALLSASAQPLILRDSTG